MKLAIMQPYFFPYLGYYSLIKNTDKFILFDAVQFIRHGWIERNRIMSIKGEPIYIKVPLKRHPRETLISEIEINNVENWREKIFAQLVHYKRKAPHYHDTINVVKEALTIDTNSITELNANILTVTCRYLGINFDCSVFTKMDLRIDKVNAPDEWALNISKAVAATHYYNPPGGMTFFDRDKYEAAGIEIFFMVQTLPRYNQLYRDNFVEGLSIIDVMMFNAPTEINDILTQFELQ